MSEPQRPPTTIPQQADRSAAAEAVLLVDRLAEHVSHLPPALALLPSRIFSGLCAAEDIQRWVAEAQGYITASFAYGAATSAIAAGQRDWFLSMLDVCAFCATAARKPPDLGWQAMMYAERNAAPLLAYRFHQVATVHAVKTKNRSNRRQQTEKNDPLRKYVLTEAAKSRFTSVTAAAGHVVKRLQSEPVGLVGALAALGGTLNTKGDDEDVGARLTKTFANYITTAVKAHAGGNSGRMSAQVFVRWKDSFRQPG